MQQHPVLPELLSVVGDHRHDRMLEEAVRVERSEEHAQLCVERGHLGVVQLGEQRDLRGP